jgi:hypothetical protein
MFTILIEAQSRSFTAIAELPGATHVETGTPSRRDNGRERSDSNGYTNGIGCTGYATWPKFGQNRENLRIEPISPPLLAPCKGSVAAQKKDARACVRASGEKISLRAGYWG